MIKHFVAFYSPGTLVSEITELEIDFWNVEKAKSMAKNIVERYGATPYGFRFYTKEVFDVDMLKSKVVSKSGVYYLGGKIMTYDEVPDTKENRILRSNMQINEMKRVIQNNNSYKVTLEFKDEDVLLDW